MGMNGSAAPAGGSEVLHGLRTVPEACGCGHQASNTGQVSNMASACSVLMHHNKQSMQLASVHHAVCRQGHAGRGSTYRQLRGRVIGRHPRGGTRAGATPTRAEGSCPDLSLSKSCSSRASSESSVVPEVVRRGGKQTSEVSIKLWQRKVHSMRCMGQWPGNACGESRIPSSARRLSRKAAAFRQAGEQDRLLIH